MNYLLYIQRGIHRSSVAAIVSILIAHHQLPYTVYVDEENETDADLNKSRHSNPSSPVSKKQPSHKKRISYGSPIKMPLATPSTPTIAPLNLSPTVSVDALNKNVDVGSGDNENEEIIECHAVLALMRILRKGLVMKQQVDNAIELCSEYYNVKESIYESRIKWENARTAEESTAYLHKAMRHLRVYTNLICYNAYLYEYYHAKKINESTQKNKYKLLSFVEWMCDREELKLWLSKMIKNKELSLSMNRIDFDDDQEEKGLRAVFEQRGTQSSVLSGNAMLKVDYFPGCAQLNTHCDASDAINFRYISSIGVSGCAIPTSLVRITFSVTI